MTDIIDTDITQSDFSEGTLTDVEADSGNFLRLSDTNVLSFDGVDDYVNCGNLGNFPTQGAIEFWMNSALLEDYNNILSTHNNGNIGIRFEENGSGTFGVVVGDDSGTWSANNYLPYGLLTNTWYHVAIVWDTTTNTKIGYLNGVQKFNSNQTLWPTTIPTFTIGLGLGFAYQRYWNGLISDVRIWNITRTQSEIQADMNKRLSGSETGLVAYYKLDGGSGTTAIDSTGSNNGTITGAIWIANEPLYFMNPYMNVLNFDGVDDYISVSDSSSLNFSNKLTISFWIKIPSGIGYWGIVSKTERTNGWQLIKNYHPRTMYFEIFENGSNSGSGTSCNIQISENIWTHVSLIVDGLTWKFYYNGILIYTYTSSRNLTYSSVPLLIGKSDASDPYLNGKLSDIRIWNITRTQAEIQSDMNKRLTGNESGLVAYYPMDEGSGTTAIDKAGSNNGTITGATWQSIDTIFNHNNRISPELDLSPVMTVENSSTEWSEKFIQNALSFDGVDDYVNSPVDLSGLYTYTIETWVKWITVSNDESYLGNCPIESVNPQYDYSIFAQTDLISEYAHPGTGIPDIGHINSNNDPTAKWYHVAIWRNHGEIRLYIDGILKGTDTVTDNQVTSTSINFGKNTNFAGDPFNGIMSEVRVWNIARTQTEIQSTMHKRINGNESGLVAYFPLNEGTGNTVIDKIGSNNGTIYGATWVTNDFSEMLTDDFSITNEIRISTDNGLTWSAWKTCTNDGSIPNLPYGTDISTSLLECRQNLSTSNPTLTPELYSLTIKVSGEFGQFFMFPF